MNDDNFVNTEVDSDQTVQTNECPKKNKFGKKLVKGIIRGIAAVFILLLLLVIILLIVVIFGIHFSSSCFLYMLFIYYNSNSAD